LQSELIAVRPGNPGTPVSRGCHGKRRRKLKSGQKISMRTVLITMAVLLFLSAGPTAPPAAGDGSSCVECHTNPKKIKSLYTPPKINFVVEEGEG
jgi:hypothetical protein